MRPVRVAALLCAAWTTTPAYALEIERLDVSYASGRYRVDAVAQVDASPRAVFAVLTDYEHLDQLDPKVLGSRVLERPEPNVAVVWTRVRACVAFVCRAGPSTS